MTHSRNALVLHPAGMVETVTLTRVDVAELGDMFVTGMVSYPLQNGVRLVLAEDFEESSAGRRNTLAAALLYGSGRSRRAREVYGSGLLYSVDRRGEVVDLTPHGRILAEQARRIVTA